MINDEMTHPMAQHAATDLDKLQAQAGEAARFLAMIGNEKRLLILCQLASGETPVAELASITGLSQSALSQHLGRLRADRLIAARKDGLHVFYRLTDARAEKLLGTLKDIFCP